MVRKDLAEAGIGDRLIARLAGTGAGWGMRVMSIARPG